MKKLFLAMVAVLAFAGAAKADVFTLDFADVTWASTLAPTNIGFDIPANANGAVGPVTINSITVDIEHTWASDITVSLTNGANVFSLRNVGQGGNQDLGTLAGNLGVPSPYTFVQTGGIAAPSWGGLGAQTLNANTWVTTEIPKAGWVLTFADTVGGDGGTFSRLSIDFDKSNIVPEPTSALALLGLSMFAIGRRRR